MNESICISSTPQVNSRGGYEKKAVCECIAKLRHRLSCKCMIYLFFFYLTCNSQQEYHI